MVQVAPGPRCSVVLFWNQQMFTSVSRSFRFFVSSVGGGVGVDWSSNFSGSGVTSAAGDAGGAGAARFCSVSRFTSSISASSCLSLASDASFDLINCRSSSERGRTPTYFVSDCFSASASASDVMIFSAWRLAKYLVARWVRFHHQRPRLPLLPIVDHYRRRHLS